MNVVVEPYCCECNQVTSKMLIHACSLPCFRHHLLKQMETRASQRGTVMVMKEENGKMKKGTCYLQQSTAYDICTLLLPLAGS